MINLYAATKSYIEDLGDFHLTLCFMDIKETEKLDLNICTSNLYGRVLKIEYWSHVDLTVAIIDIPKELSDIKEKLNKSGFTYNHEFKPHLTLCKGQTNEHDWIIGNTVLFGHTYLRLKDFK